MCASPKLKVETKKILLLFLGICCAGCQPAHREQPAEIVYGAGAKGSSDPSSDVKIEPLQTSQKLEDSPEETGVPLRVALLAPLSGTHAHEGRHMLHAAMMGVHDWKKTIELYPMDTQGTPEGVRTAYRRARAQGASIILGPLFSKELKGLYHEQELPTVISFSNDLQEKPPVSIFRLGAFAYDNIETLLSFGHQKGFKKYAILVPTSPYGKTLEHHIRDGLRKKNQECVTVIPYDTLNDAAPFKACSSVTVDAWIVTETGARFEALMRHLTSLKSPILGVGLWSEDLVLKTQMSPHVFVAMPSTAMLRTFHQRYEALFHEPPSLAAPFVYDSLSLVALLGAGGLTEDRLSQKQGFEGIQGAFRFVERRAQRHLGVFCKTDQGLQKLQQAAIRF